MRGEMLQASMQESLLMRVKGTELRSHVELLKPGDVIEFRNKLGSSDWFGPYIVGELNLIRMTLTIKRPFHESEPLYLWDVEIRLLARGSEEAP